MPIGERIRDKVAASRKRGIWMGGYVPLGYDVQDRKLVVNEAEAANVRRIFQRFIDLGPATVLARELRREGFRNKQGTLIDKGYLYRLLNNRVYLIEPPRVYRRVVCSTTRRPYRVSSGLHRTPPLLLRVGCIRWGREGGGCYTNRSISAFPIRLRASISMDRSG
jgi:hypothetical protein